MIRKYILNGRTAIVEPDLLTWARWFENADRRVGENWLTNDVRVSTVFIGLDHRFDQSGGDPLLFETMVFGGPHDQECERYSTWDEAEVGHRAMVEKVQI